MSHCNTAFCDRYGGPLSAGAHAFPSGTTGLTFLLLFTVQSRSLRFLFVTVLFSSPHFYNGVQVRFGRALSSTSSELQRREPPPICCSTALSLTSRTSRGFYLSFPFSVVFFFDKSLGSVKRLAVEPSLCAGHPFFVFFPSRRLFQWSCCSRYLNNSAA